MLNSFKPVTRLESYHTALYISFMSGICAACMSFICSDSAWICEPMWWRSVRERALVYHNGPCPSAHATRALCIRQKTRLMPVTGSHQVCTKENWFLWKTESNQGQFSHLPGLRTTEVYREKGEGENGKETWSSCRQKRNVLIFWDEKPYFHKQQKGMVGFRAKAIRRGASPPPLLLSSHQSISQQA